MNALNSIFESRIGMFIISVAALLILAFVVLALFSMVFGRRLRAPGGGRSRQPRLGVVDLFDLDKERQLVIVRRDNVEHLVMIGGPNDLLIESQIVRVEAREPRMREKEPALGGAGWSSGPAIVAGATAALPPVEEDDAPLAMPPRDEPVALQPVVPASAAVEMRPQPAPPRSFQPQPAPAPAPAPVAPPAVPVAPPPPSVTKPVFPMAAKPPVAPPPVAKPTPKAPEPAKSAPEPEIDFAEIEAEIAALTRDTAFAAPPIAPAQPVSASPSVQVRSSVTIAPPKPVSATVAPPPVPVAPAAPVVLPPRAAPAPPMPKVAAPPAPPAQTVQSVEPPKPVEAPKPVEPSFAAGAQPRKLDPLAALDSLEEEMARLLGRSSNKD